MKINIYYGLRVPIPAEASGRPVKSRLLKVFAGIGCWLRVSVKIFPWEFQNYSKNVHAPKMFWVKIVQKIFAYKFF